jgi:23S rRNA (adenine2503-C2)-methyltransferase
MPVNQKYSITELLSACKSYFERTHRRITFEWALIDGLNDSREQAIALANLLKGLTCHVNVIPLNPTSGFDGKKSNIDRVKTFQQTLKSEGVPCTIRIRRGIDIQAGCGQLASKNH